MTIHKDFKKMVRERARATGKSYQAALRDVTDTSIGGREIPLQGGSTPDLDWTIDPWFLRTDHADALWEKRFERGDLERAARALATVYPPAFCKEFLDGFKGEALPDGLSDGETQERRRRGGMAHLLASLYGPNGPFPPEVLPLGIDLAAVLSEKPPEKWLRRFQQPHEIAGAEFELQVWANAIRAGLPLRRIPESQTPTPDFSLPSRGEITEIGIEAKDLATGEGDMITYEGMPWVHTWKPLPLDRTYVVEFSAEIRRLVQDPAGRTEFRQRSQATESALQRELNRIEKAGWPLGQHQVAGAGSIHVRHRHDDEPVGVSSMVFADEPSPEKRASRILPAARKGAAQIRAWAAGSKRTGIVLIDVPMNCNADAMYLAVASDIEQRGEDYRGVGGIVLRRCAWNIDVKEMHNTYQHYACFMLLLPGSPLNDHNIAGITRGLLASPNRLTRIVRRRGEPDPAPPEQETMRLFFRRVGEALPERAG